MAIWTCLWQHSRNLRHNLKWLFALRARFKASNLNSQSCYHRTSLHKSLINAIAFKLEWFIRLAISIKGLAKLECLALRVIGSRIHICALFYLTLFIAGDGLHLHGHADERPPPSRARVLQRHGQAMRGAPPVDQPGMYRVNDHE